MRETMYDYLFRNGLVIDGTGTPGKVMDVAVADGRIVRAAPSVTEPSRNVIDAEGCILCPGWIDVHSHSDITFLYENNPGSKIYQGITTEVIGNCGFSPFPLIQEREWLKRRRTSLSFIDVEGTKWDWETFGKYCERIKKAGTNVNLVPLVGHGSLRAAVMGYENKKADKKQMEEMCALLEEHLKNGAAGLSTGLGYPPDFYGDEDELVKLAEMIGRYDRIFTFHIRGERATLFRAVKEVISVGEKSKAKVHISHLKCAGIHNAGRSKEVLEMIDDAAGRGVNITFDLYPYTAGSSYLGLVFPPAFHEGGMDALLSRLADESLRKELTRQMEEGCDGWSPLIGERQGENLMITNVAIHTECVGKRISEIAGMWNISPAEAACRLMLEEGGKVEMVMFLAEEEDMDRIALHEGCFYGTDGLAMGGELPLIRPMPHPRYYGSFPTLYERYVRSGRIPLEQLVYRMTGAAAKRFGIEERGEIRKGYHADLILFDPERYRAAATYESPCRLSEGIRYLLVNGKAEICEGVKNGEAAGSILLKQ